MSSPYGFIRVMSFTKLAFLSGEPPSKIKTVMVGFKEVVSVRNKTSCDITRYNAQRLNAQTERGSPLSRNGIYWN